MFKRRLEWVFLSSQLLLLIAGAAGIVSLVSQQNALQWVVHTREVLEVLARTGSALTDAETSQRGFLLTDDMWFVEQHDLAVKAIDADLGQLAALTMDNPVQERTLADLRQAIAAKLYELNETIRLHRSGEVMASLALVRSGRGATLMQTIRSQLQRMSVEEQRLLDERHVSAQRFRALGLFAVGFLGVLGMGLLWLMRHIARRDQRRIKASEARLATILRSIGDAVIATDGVGRIERFNKAAETLTAWNAADALGKPLEQVYRIISETTRLSMESPVQRALREGGAEEFRNHTVLLARDGCELTIEDRAAPIQHADGTVEGVVVIFRDETLRRQRERERERLLALLRCAPSFAAILDGPEHRYVFVNETLIKLFGDRNYLGRTVRQVFPELASQQIYDILDSVYRTGERFSAFDLPLMFRDPAAEGAERELMLDFIYEPMRDASGEVIGIFVEGYDVTARNRTAAALQRSESTLGAVMESLPVGVAVADAHGQVIQSNDAYRSFWGIAVVQAGDLATTPWRVFGQNGTQPLTTEQLPLMRALSHGEIVRGALLECLSVTGERRVLLSSAAPVHNADGVTVGAVVAELDITEQRTIEQAQLDAERRFRQVLEALPQLVWTCTSKGEADYFSRQWLEYTGLSLSQSVGYGWTTVVHPEDRFEFVECWQRAVREAGVFDAEVRLQGADGLYRWFKQKATPLRHADGSVSKWFGTSTDITDIIEAREKIRSANVQLERKVAARTRALEEANAELQTFAHSAAHDLRAPLRNIHGFATVLLEDEAPNLSSGGETYVRRIMDGVVRLDQLIMDLLGYSRLSRSEMQLQPVDLAELVPDVISTLSAEIEARHASVMVQNPLPAVVAERVMLGQVISNLITNALKFVPDNVQPQVRISSLVEGSTVKLMVADNGIGIAPEYRERIFKVFERLHSQEEYPGTGIGLAIVRRGIERMGGAVTLDSELGRGSTFTIELPIFNQV